jgi:hypothetical protein
MAKRQSLAKRPQTVRRAALRRKIVDDIEARASAKASGLFRSAKFSLTAPLARLIQSCILLGASSRPLV